MGEQGLLGISTPAEVGGVGGTFIDEMIACEEMSYAFLSSPAMALHSTITMPYLTHYGTKEQQERYIPPMTSGACIASIGMTEPDAGSDLQGIRTHAKKNGSDWIIKGSKLNKLGLKGQDTAELFFEDVRVPGSALLGKENFGFYQLMEQLPQERLLIAVHSIAHSEAIFEETREWVKQRKAFGRRVADLQTVH